MKAKKLECIDGETLMDMRLESIRYCVEGLLPQGVAMIGGVPIIGNLCRAKAMESVSSISVMIPEVTAVTLRTAILAVSKLPSLPFLSSLLLRESVLHNHALTQLQLRQAERPAVRQTQKAGQKPGPTFISTTEVTITANRKRNQTISIRLTPTEKKEIIAKAKQAQMTLTDYLIECSRNTEIKVTNLTEVLVELKRIGNNINQIARKVNSKRFFFGNFNSVIEGQRKIYDAIPDGEKQQTGWEDSRKLYEQHLKERAQSKTETQRIADSYSNVGNGISSLAGAVSKIVDNDSEDPDERRKRIEAEENGSTLGSVLGLGIGMIANAINETPEQELDYEQEEYKTREEILNEIFGADDYDYDDSADEDEDTGFSMTM